jgi:stage V sporulation protein B
MVKKDSLIKGTIILAAAALVARFLGIFQRVPLEQIMGDAGDAYFALANNLYLLLLIIATGGIPSTISKMISERYAQGKSSEARRIYRAALWFGACTGVIISIFLFAAAPLIANVISKEPGAAASYRAIAPALLFFPIIAMMRGYFQGRQFMTAGGVSQIIEQILRVITGVGLAFVVLSWGYEEKWVAAAATFGSVFGSVGAFLIMLWYAAKLRKQDKADEEAAGQSGETVVSQQSNIPFRTIYAEIFRMSLPIVLTAMTIQFLYMVDTLFFNRLTGSFYHSAVEAKSVLGALGMKAQAIAGIPPILAIALSTSIIPVISSAYAVRNLDEVRRQSSLVMRIVVFTGVPAALALTVASVSVTGFLFSPGGGGIVAALTAGTIFQITMMTSNSVLFGMGKASVPMRHTIIGMAVKVAGSLLLAPLLGVYGLIIASTLCFILVTWLNLRAIQQEAKLQVLGSRWPAYLASIVITAAAGWGLDTAGRSLLDFLPQKLAYFLTAAVTGTVVLALYLILLVLLRVVIREDVQNFPGPLRKVFSKLVRLRSSGAE